MYFNAINLIIFASIRFISTELITLTCHQVKRFVDGHNSRRLLLAEGDVPYQPKAALMYFMVWDEELKQKAADWASQNKFHHNPNVTLASGRFITGENIHMTKTTNRDRIFDVDEALASWWEEHKNYQYEELKEKHFKSKQKQVGHYIQMAWADSIYLGCALSKFIKDIWNTYIVVCYYGPAGNIIHEYPYKAGGEYGQKLKCHESIGPECKRFEYGGCEPTKYDQHTTILRAPNITDLELPEKHIVTTMGTNAVGAVKRIELVELHENVMAVPRTKNDTEHFP